MPLKYDDLTREQLKALLERRDQTEKRFGLVWDSDELEREHALNDDFVVLDLDESLSVGLAPWHNLLIEGNNFDALRYLQMTFAGKIKCIIIDPPYNTGNKDFIYNDNWVDKDDRYRHSKWLEHMFRVLTLARDLLAPNGVILVHIGEEEIARLGCLMDQVFPERKIATFVWRRRSGANDATGAFVSIDHEYVLCYGNPEFSFEGDVKSTQEYRNPDNDDRGPWVSGDLTTNKNLKQRSNAFYPIYNPNTSTWYACDPDNTWRFATETKLKTNQRTRSDTMEQTIAKKKILWPPNETPVTYNSVDEIISAVQNGTAPRNLRWPEDEAEQEFWRREFEFWVGKSIGYGKPRYKRHLSELKTSQSPLSTWILPAAMKKKDVEQLDLEGVETLITGYTTEGTSLLQEMLGNKDFPYPKPLSLVQGLIKQATGPDDIVLDFFAGSGTTGHAVLSQNAQDSGNRRFILVSSTEATAKEPNKNVCRDITQKRLTRAIEGYSYQAARERKAVEGLGGNFAYARTRRIPAGKVLRRIQHDQVWHALQLMHERPLAAYRAGVPCVSESENEVMLYLPHLNNAANRVLENVVRDAGKRSLLVYAWQPEVARSRVLSWSPRGSVDVLPIPQTLMERFGIR